MMRSDFTSASRVRALPSPVRGVLQLLWQLIRVPVYALLRIAQPAVRLVLVALGLVSFLLAFFYHFASALPHPPFVPLLGISLLCGVLLVGYEALLRALS